MSADIVNLRPKLAPKPPRDNPLREVVRTGPTQYIAIVAETAAEIGAPLVEVRCPYGESINLTPDRAEEFAAALIRAAAKARA